MRPRREARRRQRGSEEALRRKRGSEAQEAGCRRQEVVIRRQCTSIKIVRFGERECGEADREE